MPTPLHRKVRKYLRKNGTRETNPYVWKFSFISWQVFATFTFSRENLPEKIRFFMLYAALRKFSKKFKIRFQNLKWALRQENGGITGRRHFHLLIAGLKEPISIIAACEELAGIWRAKGCSAVVEPVYFSLGVTEYLLKYMNFELNRPGAVISSKLGVNHCEPLFSTAAEKQILKRASRERDA